MMALIRLSGLCPGVVLGTTRYSGLVIFLFEVLSGFRMLNLADFSGRK